VSELTVKLRNLASGYQPHETVSVRIPELLELIGIIEEHELQDEDVTELKDKVTTYRRSADDHKSRISEIRGLPKYVLDKNHGVEKTPVGDYIRAEDVEFVVNDCKCGKHPSTNFYHTCPYGIEIHGSYNECNCCGNCEDICAQEI
jgi:hypothetical protein